MRPLVSIAALVVLVSFDGMSQVALSPATPAITAPAPVLVPSSPALAPVATSPGFVATNASLLALADALVVLQTNIQQTLPVLSMFNDNFDFASLGDNGLGATASGAPPGNFSTNLGTNYAVNFGVNAATPTGPSLFNTVANRTTLSAAGLPQGFATVPVTRDTLRALIVLQSDLQRMLPILNGLNGGTTNYPGSFTNLFGLTPTGR
ncbi:MAG TPA: hypothetical protein VFE51_07865 [Verrucomicrobiae bacterium]|nr:hypothetical protein [Verrucomicrobiae bacterium]